jgi:Acetyltransferase (GNAT) domain
VSPPEQTARAAEVAIEDVAEALLTGLLASAGSGTAVFVDMPEANRRAQSLRGARDMEPSFETVRMYLHGRPPEDVETPYRRKCALPA